MKNLNKKAGNWGALNNKPLNQVYFKDGGKVKVTAGGEKHVIYKKTTKRGEGKVGSIMVNHPTKDKGKWDTIDLTKKAGAKTIKQGVAATKKWHKENPYNDMKKQLTKKQMGGTSPKVKTRTVTTNPGGYSKTIVKTKTVDRPGKQGTTRTTKTIPTAKGVGSNVASGVRRSFYDAKETVGNKLTKIKANRSGKVSLRNERQKERQELKDFRKALRSDTTMQKGGTIANARKKSLINRYNKVSDKLKNAEARQRNLEAYEETMYDNYDSNSDITGANPTTFTAGRKRQNAKINKGQARIGENAFKEKALYNKYRVAEREYNKKQKAGTATDADENKLDNALYAYSFDGDKYSANTSKTLKKIAPVENRVSWNVTDKLRKNEKRAEKISNKLDKINSKKQRGGSLVTKSQSGQYKMIENPTKGVTKSRRTVKGFVKGAPSIKKVKKNYNNLVDNKLAKRAEMRSWNTGASEGTINSAVKIPTYKQYLTKQKSGGTIKKKK